MRCDPRGTINEIKCVALICPNRGETRETDRKKKWTKSAAVNDLMSNSFHFCSVTLSRASLSMSILLLDNNNFGGSGSWNVNREEAMWTFFLFSTEKGIQCTKKSTWTTLNERSCEGKKTVELTAPISMTTQIKHTILWWKNQRERTKVKEIKINSNVIELE